MIGARAVSNDLSLHHALAFNCDRLLIDASVLVGTLEFRELINIAAHFARQLPGMMLAFDSNDDALGIDRVDNPVTTRQHHGTGIAGGYALHSSSHNRSFCAKQWHRLPLHVRAHQRSVGVVVLQEWNQ